MSESHRDHDKSSNINLSQNHRNSKDQSERYNRKRSHLDSENLDAKVYIKNVPTKKVTDEELLDFFKPFGKISDIQVFKDHIFVQYNRTDDAKNLIKEAQMPLIFKGNKLDILPAREVRLISTRSSSTDRSSKQ